MAQIENELPDYSNKDWVSNMILAAVEQRASDIHIEPGRDGMQIRFRVDGQLRPYEGIQSGGDEIIARIKVLSELDIAERRMPQDGHFEMRHERGILSVRVSTMPTIYGEAAVMRLLNPQEGLPKLEDLALDPPELELINRLIASPSGMILSTGPTGSGKTMLLYAILQALQKPSNNIITIEDPVEMQMPGARQIQVSEGMPLNFSHVLRSIFRQDPDIIMVGEIRDAESAQISIQAALTGRLVLSTMHTFNIFSLVARFLEMEIPRSILANAINAVISPRLLRKICPSCQVLYEPKPLEKKIFGSLMPDSQYYIGQGCAQCAGSGYLGRLGIFEIIAFDDEIRSVILGSPNLSELLDVIKKKNIKSLTQRGMDKVLQGLTTISEVIRVTGGI